MERYGVIVTEKVEPGCVVFHWLKRGTIVRYLTADRVQCVTPCYPIEEAVEQMGLKTHVQYVKSEDVLELPPEQLTAVQLRVV